MACIAAEENNNNTDGAAAETVTENYENSTAAAILVDVAANKKENRADAFMEGRSEDGESLLEGSLGGNDIGGLFDDPNNNHGKYRYKWPAEVGDKPAGMRGNSIVVDVAESTFSDVDNLMAHYVWESSIALANLVAKGEIYCRGKNVLELGAGSALPSIVAALVEPKYVIASDYPDESLVKTMQENLRANIKEEVANNKALGFKWGEPVEPLLDLVGGDKFDVILCADTLWLHQEHESLAKTCLECLRHGKESAVYLTYQHHNEHAPTFFNIAKRMGFEVEEEYMMLGWGDRDVATLLELAEEEDLYGPIYVSKMYILDGKAESVSTAIGGKTDGQ